MNIRNLKGTIDPPEPKIPKELRLTGFSWLEGLQTQKIKMIFSENKKTDSCESASLFNIHLH